MQENHSDCSGWPNMSWLGDLVTMSIISNQVDFRAPPIKSVADFLMYLIQDRKLQPSTIGGYRSAIADKLGNSLINVSKDENLTRLLVSTETDPNDGRESPPGTSPWCYTSLQRLQLNQLKRHF